MHDMTASDLLETFVGKFNAVIDELNTCTDELATAMAELEHLRRTNAEHMHQLDAQATEIAVLLSEKSQLQKTCEVAANALLEYQAEKQAFVRKIQQLSADTSELAALRAELKSLRELNPKKLKEQIKRVKEANDALNSRNERLARENSAVLSNFNRLNAELTKKTKALIAAQGAGIFHKGSHHLVVWPQVTKMRNEDTGQVFSCQSLLYMHQSGRGALLTYNNQTGVAIAKQPRAGLRPCEETMAFATQWLQRVNDAQGGEIEMHDLKITDYNNYAAVLSGA